MRRSEHRRAAIAAFFVASGAIAAGCSSANESSVGGCGDFDFASTKLGSRYRLSAEAAPTGTMVFDRDAGVVVRTMIQDGGTVVEHWVVVAPAGS
jgi:hypothetical protein